MLKFGLRDQNGQAPGSEKTCSLENDKFLPKGLVFAMLHKKKSSAKFILNLTVCPKLTLLCW